MKMENLARWVVVLAVGVGSAAVAVAADKGKAKGADKGKGAAKGPAVSDEARAEAKTLFDTVCSACHGPGGAGDGAAAAALNPKPASFTSGDWQKGITDAQIDKVITEGGQAVGKSPVMPPQPQLKDAAKAQVLQALREHIRSLGPKK